MHHIPSNQERVLNDFYNALIFFEAAGNKVTLTNDDAQAALVVTITGALPSLIQNNVGDPMDSLRNAGITAVSGSLSNGVQLILSNVMAHEANGRTLLRMRE